MNRQFHPGELSGADDGEPTTAELNSAVLAARDLESQLSASDIHPSADFVDRVMTAVAEEPRPQPAVAAGFAMRRGRFGAMVAALADSWRVAFSSGRPLAVRAQAAAFVLVVVLAVGSLGGIAAVGTVRFLAPAPSQTPTRPIVAPTAPPRNSTAQPTPTPALPTEDKPGAEPTDGAEATDSPEPTESEHPAKTPSATRTPRPTKEPNETPEPTETEDPSDDSGDDSGSDSTPEP